MEDVLLTFALALGSFIFGWAVGFDRTKNHYHDILSFNNIDFNELLKNHQKFNDRIKNKALIEKRKRTSKPNGK